MNMNTNSSSVGVEIEENERKAALKEWGEKYKKPEQDYDKIEDHTIQQVAGVKSWLTKKNKTP